MNCAYHPEVEHVAFCIKCGKPLCTQCVRQVQASIYCESCLAEVSAPRVPPGATPPPIGSSSPEAAFVLGLIPGVGAIYNAEYFKAALHLVIFATLVTLVDSVRGAGEFFLGLLAFGFYVYMPFEAYYTAKKRKLAREGIDLVTPFDQLNDQFGQFGSLELWGGVALVAVGILFLLDNFGIVSFDRVAQFWPVLLILVGVFFIRRFQKGKQV
jgi:hypothetical protein